MAERSYGRLRTVPEADSALSTVHVGNRLRRLRQERGWSIETAAARAGLSRNRLGSLETAALPNPTLSTLLTLMELYDAGTIEDLLGSAPSRTLLRAWVTAGRPGTRLS